MVDLQTEYKGYKQEMNAALEAVLNKAAFIGGAAVKQFEENLAEYLGCKHVIACANGTDALQIALMALDLPKGSEVITPSFTYISTVEVVALLGLTPVFVEVDPNTFLMDMASLEKAIGPNTKAIIPVHLFGQCADMDPLMEVAEKHALHVIEDTAQTIGANYLKGNSPRKSGTIGHIGCTSFYPSKNLGCYGDGGAMFTNDDELAKKLRMIANHGQSERYYFSKVGVNSRLDGLQAAILNVKLPHLDTYCQKRQEIAQAYNEGLQDLLEITTPAKAAWSEHVYHQYTMKVERRDELKEFLQQQNIPSMIYYPVPAHLQEAYRGFGYSKDDLLVTEGLCEKVLSLPIHPYMEQDQIDHIIKSIFKFYRR